MSNVLGYLSAGDLNSTRSVSTGVAVTEVEQDTHIESQTTNTGLNLASPKSDFARSDGQSESGGSYATAASEPDKSCELADFSLMLHSSLLLNKAIHAITNTYQPTTTSSISPKKDDTTISSAVVYRADHFNSDGTGRPSEQMHLTGLMKNILSGSRQESVNKSAKRFSAKPGPKEGEFFAQPSSYFILPVFDDTSNTLCWWSIAIDPPHAGVEQSKSQERHRGIEAPDLKVDSANCAWWDVPPGLSVLARTVARRKQDSLASTDSLPATRQHRFSNSSFGSDQSLTDHQMNLLSSFKDTESPCESPSVQSRPITIDSGIDMSYDPATSYEGLASPELASASARLSHVPRQSRNAYSSVVDSSGQHNRVMSQHSEAGGVSLWRGM